MPLRPTVSRALGRALRAAQRLHNAALRGNFGAIVPHQAYRSGQVSGPRLRASIDRLGLRSVINLRGRNDARWYHQEVAACRAAGVQHFDVAMTGREIPAPQTVLHLLDVFRQAPRPLLVHCQGGADRAGLASTLFLLALERVPFERACEAGLTVWYGYLPLGPCAELVRFLAFYRDGGNGKPLEAWVREDYPLIYQREWVQARRSLRRQAEPIAGLADP